MSASGHETLKEVERYTKAANRERLANSAIAALQTAQEERARDSKLASSPGNASQIQREVPVLPKKTLTDGGGGWIRTNVGLANGFTVRPL